MNSDHNRDIDKTDKPKIKALSEHGVSQLLESYDSVYKLIFLNAPLGIARVSQAGIFVDVNPALCKIFGASREQLLGRSVMSFTHPKDMATSMDYLSQMNAGIMSRFTLEKSYIRTDGNEITVNLTVSAVRLGRNAAPFFISTFEDVSEKNTYLQQLILRQGKYQSVLETTQDGFWIVDFSGKVLEVNNSMCRLLGYNRDEMLAMQVSDFEADETPEQVRQRIEEVRQTGYALFETHHKRKDGSIVPLRVSVNYDPQLGEQLFAFFQDMTEIRNSSRMMQAVNQELVALKEALPDIIIFKDNFSRWRLINRQAYKIFGFEDDSWTGKSDQELAASRPEHRDLHANFARGEDKIWASGHPDFSIFWFKNMAGQPVVLEVRKTPIYSDDGKPKSMLIVARDVSELERRKLEAEHYKKKNAMIERRAREAEYALVDISENTLRLLGQELHDDLGQMLSAAAMYAESLFHRLKDTDEKNANQIEQIKKILNQAISKTRAISHGLYPVETQGASLLQMLTELARQTGESHGINVKINVSGEIPKLDEPRNMHLYRIVQEALHNVVRHSAAANVAISLQYHPGQLHLMIADDGIGIGKPGTSRSGIGLQSMKQRAAILKANLRIVGLKQGGTHIKVMMPVE